MTVLANGYDDLLGVPGADLETHEALPDGYDDLIGISSATVVLHPALPEGYDDLLGVPTAVDFCADDLTDNDIIAFQWDAGDQQMINKIVFEYDYDATAGTYEKMVIYTHDESIRRFGIRPELRIQSQGLHSSLGADAFVEDRAREVFARFGDAPPAIVKVAVFYRRHPWEVGDIICLSSAFIPNLLIGGRGLDEEPFELVDCRPQFGDQGQLHATLIDIEALTNQPAYTGVISITEPTAPDTDYVSELGLLGVSAGVEA